MIGEKWEKLHNIRRLEVVENVLETLEKNEKDRGLTREETFRYNNLVKEHKLLIDKTGFARCKV